MSLDLPSAQALLLPGILAFYLFDAALLLYADEVVFTRTGRRWRAVLGQGAAWSGRSLSLPTGLSPGSPLLRSAWRVPEVASPSVPLVQLLAVVAPLRWHAWLLAASLLLGVPAALYWRPGPFWLLALLGLIYLPTLAAVLYLWHRRQMAGLSRRQVLAIAFDVLACPPFALNLVSRVTLRCGPALPAAELAAQLLDSTDGAALDQAIAARREQLRGLYAGTDDKGGGGR